MSLRPVPFTVIGGYLGAGKTTLLNQLLGDHHGLRLAVIVNDFGDISIDGDLVAAADSDTITLANGCICCSLTDGLATVLNGLRQRADVLDHVVVEASGVSDPVRIGYYAMPFGFELRGIIVLADAEQVRSRAVDKYVGDTVVTQLRGADVLVLTKLDLVDTTQAEAVRSWLRGLAPVTPVVESVNGRLSTAIALGELEASAVDARGHVHALDYETASITTHDPVDRADLDAALDALPDGVLRAKGFVQLADDPDQCYLLQVVGRRRSLTRTGGWDGRPETRLVLIGVPGTLDRQRLERTLFGGDAPTSQDALG